MLYQIKSSKLLVTINSFGAELTSVKNVEINNEFIWIADKKYWGEHAPTLFPFVGRLEGEKYSYKGKTYDMKIHGFAKSCEFNLKKHDESSISFELSSNSFTKSIYPFDFLFVVTYEVQNENLAIKYSIENKDNKPMIFSYGFHPGFNVPINGKGNFNDYFIEFTRENYLMRQFERGLDISKDVPITFENKILKFDSSTFDNSLFYKNAEDVITLRSNVSNDFIKVTFNDMTSLGLWKANDVNAKYVCIEPWHGFPGPANILDDLEKHIEMVNLDPSETYEHGINVEFHVE